MNALMNHFSPLLKVRVADSFKMELHGIIYNRVICSFFLNLAYREVSFLYLFGVLGHNLTN